MILLTGASGTLGQHLKFEAARPTHDELDITRPFYAKSYDLIVHAAAYTDVERAEKDKLYCFKVNVTGTLNILDAYPDTPIVYISSEYSHNPVNFYSLTKNLAEQLVMRHPKHLIIRTLFKPTPWKYDKAFIDQWTQGDSVEVIAPLIEKAVNDWDKETSKLIYVGTGRKRIYDIAVKSKPDVIPNSVEEIKTVKIPKDYV